MSLQSIIRIALIFLGYYLLQILVFKGFILYSYAFCFIYISALLQMPRDFDRTLLIGLAFVVGLLVDMFYNTGAIHAAASVFIAWSRGFVLDTVIPSRGLDGDNALNINAMSLPRFVTYSGIMIFLHHAVLFFVEAGNSGTFFNTFFKTLASSVLSLFVIAIFQILQRDK